MLVALLASGQYMEEELGGFDIVHHDIVSREYMIRVVIPRESLSFSRNRMSFTGGPIILAYQTSEKFGVKLTSILSRVNRRTIHSRSHICCAHYCPHIRPYCSDALDLNP